MLKKFDRDFNPTKNETVCYIHINNIEVPVAIKNNGDTIILSFRLKGKLYESNKFKCESSNKYFYSDNIQIEGIKLNDIDKNNLAICINKIFDRPFN